MRRIEVSPAALGSLALHLGVAVALMVHLGSRELKVGSVVPVTIVSNAPAAEPPPALEAPVDQTAQAEEPVPEPTPPAPPAPQPTPTPVKPATKAAPQPAPVPVKPEPTKAAPAKPAAAKPEKSLDLDALAASISRPASRSAAQTGPSRPQTAPAARDAVGDALAAGQAIKGLAEELQRRWNPNCDVEGGRDVLVRVTFLISGGGQVSGTPTVEFASARTPVAEAAADRAVRAVFAASPFRNLPREFYGQRVKVNFIARDACAYR